MNYAAENHLAKIYAAEAARGGSEPTIDDTVPPILIDLDGDGVESTLPLNRLFSLMLMMMAIPKNRMGFTR